MHYDFVPTPRRKPLRWPEGKRLAIIWTWREYGQRVGVWRMFDVFDAEGMPSSCTMNAKMALERRAMIDAAVEKGWEIVPHDYVQTDLPTDDQLYPMRTASGKTMVSAPCTSEVNDFAIFMRQAQTADGGFAVFREQFDWLYAETERSRRRRNPGLHPHAIGQPFRIRALRDFIRYAKTFEGVWFATREEIAEWYPDNHESHIPSSEGAA